METSGNNLNGDAKTELKVERIMISKFQLIAGILLFVVPIVGFFFKIQLDVALIKQNHEMHMQEALEKIAELDKQQANLMKKIDADHEAIIRLLEMHNK